MDRVNLLTGFLVRDIPKLARDYLYRAFYPIARRRGLFVVEYPPLFKEWCVCWVTCVWEEGWESVDERVSELVIGSKCCNEEEVTEVDLERFVSLKVFEVGNKCFKNVNEVKIIGLSQLEMVVIGMNSFTKKKNSYGNDPNHHFYLKNCERLRELKMGRCSFSDYSVCEIENVPSLEVIEMGEMDGCSYNFHYASLELKSDSERRK